MLSFNSFQLTTLIITAIAFAVAANYYLNSLDRSTPMTLMTSPLAQVAKSAMSSLSHAKIVHRPSSTRGHADHGWLNTYHSFSFANWYDPRFESFGALRVLNEDRVAPGTGFPTHPHRDAEIFSYIISGELTHRDSMQRKGAESNDKNQFYRMKRGDVQFTTGGKGIAHSEQNEHSSDWTHFLQIWALPWKKGLKPTYHTSTFSEADKKAGFVTIISPLKAGRNATDAEEAAAVPTLPGTIPVHADLIFSAAIIPPATTFEYEIGADAALSKSGRQSYIHLPMTKGGKACVRLAGQDQVLKEGDGAFVSQVNSGDILTFENIGDVDAEVVVLDSN